MAKPLSDADIDAILTERKPITKAVVAKLKSPKKRKNRRELHAVANVTGNRGKKYRITVRQSPKRPMSFSVILAIIRSRGKLINLIRCNGHHPEHRNPLEHNIIPRDTCHVHRITERYQQYPNVDPEHFADSTEAYFSLAGAVEYVSERFGLFVSDDPYRGGLFVSQE